MRLHGIKVTEGRDWKDNVFGGPVAIGKHKSSTDPFMLGLYLLHFAEMVSNKVITVFR